MNRFFTDSRLVTKGSVFFALKGERIDGHHFLAEAASKGAVYAYVDHSYQGPDYGLHLIRVENVLSALQEKGREALSNSRARVVGVTGSVGKTTTKDFIFTLLRQKYQTSASPGNGNSQVGVPLSLLNHLKSDTELYVQEMAMTEFGNIRNLSSIAGPEVALITSIALTHACNFSSLRDIALAKGEIFSNPETKLGILNRDHPYFVELCRIGTCRKESYSTKDSSAEYYLNGQRELFVRGVSVGILPILPFLGVHNDQNLLGAIAVARYFEIEWDLIFSGIEKLELPERRLQMVQKKGIQFVNDSYNACTVSMKAAFLALPAPQKEKKTIAVLGEMLELGKFSEVCHQEVGEASLNAVDDMICYGEECAPIVSCWNQVKRPVQWTCDFTELMEIVRNLAEPGDVVLLKGSCGKQLWRVVEEL